MAPLSINKKLDNGAIKHMLHIHHILPKYLGGTDDGGVAGAKSQIEKQIGIFGYSLEEKSRICAKGGAAAGKISGANHRDNKTGIFDEQNRKFYSSLGGRAQRGFKKHYHENGDSKMALPGSAKSADLIANGYFLK